MDTWDTWTDLGGETVQEGLAVATNATGRISLFAGTDRTVVRWDQEEDGTFSRPAVMLRRAATGPVSVAREHNGRLLLVYRAGDHGDVTILRQTREGNWPTQPAVIQGRGGFGPVAAFSVPRPNGVTLLAHRDDEGILSLSRQPTGSGMSTEWESAGGMFLRSPAIAADAEGRLVLAVFGCDGVLRVARQTSTGDAGFGDWAELPQTGVSRG